MVTKLPNTSATFALGLAAMLEGIVQVPLPPGLGGSELRTIVSDARPRLALVSPDADDGPDEVTCQWFGDAELAGATPRDPSASWPRTRPMAYTSGTTGRRKGVHVGVHEPAWGEAVVRDEREAFDDRHGGRHLVVSPLYHSGPFRFAAVTALGGGEVAVLPRFDARAWLDALRSLRPTSVFCVPTHLQRLLALADLRPDDLASLQLLAHAGAPCPVPVKERLLELAPDGVVWEFYGSTEGQFTVCPPDVWRRDPGTVGRARPGRRLEVRSEDGAPCPAGTTGTVWVEAPDHARWEYWDAPGRTAAAWDGHAFSVGDLGHLTPVGLLHLDGRPGDLVISGGVNVYPAEVERHLLSDGSVAEAVVYGVPDDEWGERVVAAVVAWPGRSVDTETLRGRLRSELSPAQVPKRIRVVEELPRTPTGKVRRTGIAEALAEAGDG